MTVAVEPALPARIPEADLWSAVLFQVLVDLASSNRYDRDGAERWIGRSPSRDFILVCDLAGIEARAAHRFLVGLLDLPKEARRAFGHGENGRASRVDPRGHHLYPPNAACAAVAVSRHGVGR